MFLNIAPATPAAASIVATKRLCSAFFGVRFTDRDDRTLLYLGMTRAEDALVILHSGHSKLVDEISRSLSGQNATALQA